ncbi:hypothetical protein GGQ87_002457 [Brevundimonas alba]|uniref:Lipoprotein n=1 Tax=Brevundimonas alba TaxID=74314 RepID=A0A7X5YLN3_9CAUL|nr:hypothetical protein [Brevundimonas alba]NJC42162.1 hypothetical protein [Brevundimonas alba]
MKSKAFAVLSASTLILTLTACASTPASGGFDPSGTSFTGWVRFTGEEFQLYADHDQVLQPFSRPCVSGAASRDEMRQAARDLGGQEVIITGRTAAWSASLPGARIEHEGSSIRNDCGGAFVILADDIRPAN